MRVAIYIRVSTTKQAVEGYSLDAQKKMLTDYCKSNKYQITDVYADEGISGKDIKHRESFKKLLSDSKRNLFDIVLVWKLTRFTRSLKDLITTCEFLEFNNISLVSYSESFDTSTSSGRMMRNLLGVIAQWEREIISENVKVALSEKVQQGETLSTCCLGYDRRNSEIFINDKEAEIIRKIFESYVKLQDFSKVSRLLTAQRIKGKKGGNITPQAILVILTNPIYCGYNRHRGQIYKGTQKQIISVSTFNAVQKLVALNNKGRIRKTKLLTIK